MINARSHLSAKFASASEAIGYTITGIGRRGKYLWLTLGDETALVVHLGMSGQMLLGAPTSARARRHDDGADLPQPEVLDVA